MSMQLYANPYGESEQLGTDLYYADRNVVKTMPYRHNAGYMFGPSNDTWHGLELKEIKRERRSLLINYVTFETCWQLPPRKVRAGRVVVHSRRGPRLLGDTSRVAKNAPQCMISEQGLTLSRDPFDRAPSAVVREPRVGRTGPGTIDQFVVPSDERGVEQFRDGCVQCVGAAQESSDADLVRRRETTVVDRMQQERRMSPHAFVGDAT